MLSCYIRLEKVFVVVSVIKYVIGFKDSITSYSKTLALKKKKEHTGAYCTDHYYMSQ